MTFLTQFSKKPNEISNMIVDTYAQSVAPASNRSAVNLDCKSLFAEFLLD